MKKEIIILLLLIITFLVKSQNQSYTYPGWLNRAIFYQIYTQSFKDSNGDGIGDIPGIIEKLDYFTEIGFNALWINPCFESTFRDAGYDITNYYQVAPRYGTNEDVKQLINEAHKKGIKICLDLVAGHTSDQHDWFKQSQKRVKNDFSDRYIWTNSKETKPENFVSGNFQRNGTYLKNYFDCQPALNYGYANPNPKNKWEQPVTATGPQKTKEELKNIITFWMDMGADGFRVDMAYSVIKNDKDFSVTFKFWQEIRIWFHSKYPNGCLIAEWGCPELAINAGFMIDFMMHYWTPGYPSLFFNQEGTVTRNDCFFSIEGSGSPVEFIKYYTEQMEKVEGKGFVSIPSANHDFQRPASGTRNTENQLKVLMTFLLTLKGVPFIYYGDEIGMRYLSYAPEKEGSGKRSGSRTPMQWNANANAGFSISEENDLYLPIDTNILRPNVQFQLSNPSSLLNHVRKLIEIRQSNEALGNTGEFIPLYAKENKYPLVFLRKKNNSQFLIVINPSGKQAVAEFYMENISNLTPVLVDKANYIKTGKNIKLFIDQVSYAIFEIQ